MSNRNITRSNRRNLFFTNNLEYFIISLFFFLFHSSFNLAIPFSVAFIIPLLVMKDSTKLFGVKSKAGL